MMGYALLSILVARLEHSVFPICCGFFFRAFLGMGFQTETRVLFYLGEWENLQCLGTLKRHLEAGRTMNFGLRRHGCDALNPGPTTWRYT